MCPYFLYNTLIKNRLSFDTPRGLRKYEVGLAIALHEQA